MSATIPENFDPLEQARFDATHQPGSQEELYHEWLGDAVDSQAAADMAAYLESRPYKVDRAVVTDPLHPEYGQIVKPDAVIDPATGKVMNDDWDYSNRKREEHFDATAPSYENAKISDLAKMWGQAELDKDRTKAEDLQDVLLEKMESFAKQQKTDRHPEGMSRDAQDKLFERVIRVKEDYKNHARNIEKESQEQHTEPNWRFFAETQPSPAVQPEDEVTQEVEEQEEVQEAETPTSRFRRAGRRLQDLYLGVMTRTRNSAHGAMEYFTDEERSRRRTIIGGAVATIALAGAGYAVYRFGFSSGGGHNVHHVANHVPVKGSGSQAEIATSTPRAHSNVNLHQLSWDVAHKLHAGHETATMQTAINHYNALHNTYFALTSHDGTTMIMNGQHIISPAEMYRLNELMLDA